MRSTWPLVQGFWFGQTVVDVGFGAGELEGVGAEQLSLLKSELDLGDCGASIAGRGEVDPVVGEYGMDFVRNGLDQGFVLSLFATV